MHKDILKPGVPLQSDTIYVAQETHYHIYEQDTVYLDNDLYLSFSEFHHGCLQAAFYLHGLKNVELDFAGAIITLHGRIQPFLLDSCENVTIRNVTVEYDRSFYTELEIIRNENDNLHLRPLPQFPCRVENGYLIPYGSHWENRSLNQGDMFLQAFDTVTGEGTGLAVVVIGERVSLHDTPPCEVQHLKVREHNGEIILSGNIPPEWDHTMTVVLAHEFRDISSVYLCRSSTITISNYRILNGAGMGVLGMYSKNITIERLLLTRDARSHGIIANVADAIHLIASSGSIVIRDCICEGMVDDALNIHTNYLEVTEAKGTVLKVLRHKESHMLNAHFQLLGIGDCIAIHNGLSMENRQTTVIRDFRVLDNYHLEIHTADVIKAAAAGDLVENLSTQPDILIEHCTFGKANSNLRLQTRGKTKVSNCKISIPLMLTGDTNYWREASPIQDLTICSNRFTGARAIIRSIPENFVPTPAAPYYHQNVRIVNNQFTEQNVLEANDTDNIVFRDNTCIGTKEPFTIRLCRCGHVDTDENSIIVQH